MKYELIYVANDPDWGETIRMDSPCTFIIYSSMCIGGSWWPKGFWDNPDYTLGIKEPEEYTEMKEDYFAHREEYIAAAKKLLIKERL